MFRYKRGVIEGVNSFTMWFFYTKYRYSFLMDVIIDFLPSPEESKTVEGINPKDEEEIEESMMKTNLFSNSI